ncbi:LCP family protein [bacterium]|nr:LCP family protein [bacterium]
MDLSLKHDKSKKLEKHAVYIDRKDKHELTEKELKHHKRKLFWEIPLGIFLGLILTFGGLVAYKTFIAAKKIITENTSGSAPALTDNLNPKELKGEGDGRINILLMGMGGEGHSGSYLTDTLVVVSIDPKTKDVAMLSIPRDFYIYIPKYGYSKINAAYTIGMKNNKNNGGISMTKDIVSDLLDLNIHYGVVVDFDGFKDIVDSLGGVTVDVEKDLVDTQYPTEKYGYETIRFKKGTQKMDGNTALKYSRSRHSTSDFDRAARQQAIMVAIKNKALGMDTLLNPAKISSLMDALGSHLKTDIQLWEIQRLIEIFKEVDSNKIVNKVISPEEGLVKTSSINGASVVVPVAGDYSEIRKFAHELFVDNYLKDENASISILNGTTKSGSAKTLSEMLKSYSYNVVKNANADNTNYKKTIIYDNTKGKKPYTLEFLKKRLTKLGVSAEIKSGGDYSEDITIIVGSDYKSK